MNYLDGPLFFAWLVSERPSVLKQGGTINASKFGKNGDRGLRRWRKKGVLIRMDSLAFEEVLDALELGVWEVPENLRRERWKQDGPKIGKKTHDKIVSLYAAGATVTQISKATRVSRGSVRRHIEQEVG